jgi:hypothetical protein
VGDIKLTDDLRLIPIPGEIALEMNRRFLALRGMVECIRQSLEHAQGSAAIVHALHGVGREIEQVAIDLDVRCWDAPSSQARTINGANTHKV